MQKSNDSFKQLQAEWYGKLKVDGFEDIEATETDSIIRPQIFTVPKEATGVGMDYYDFCQRVLREYPFKRDIDRAIFELHAEGKSEREIEAWLAVHSYKPLKQKSINLIINKIKQTFQGS